MLIVIALVVFCLIFFSRLDDSTISEGEYDETQHEFSYYYEEDSSHYTGRTDQDKSVLNDHWVSEPPRYASGGNSIPAFAIWG